MSEPPRAEEEWGRAERMGWLLLSVFLAVVAIRAIGREDHGREIQLLEARRVEDRNFAAVLRQNQQQFSETMPAGVVQSRSQPKTEWIITFPFDVKHNQPIKVNADGRLEALTSIRVTVWSKPEWDAACWNFKGTQFDCTVHTPETVDQIERDNFESECKEHGGKIVKIEAGYVCDETERGRKP